ncbi:MAG: TPD domain-containing protein [Thermoplasmata archaeon]
MDAATYRRLYDALATVEDVHRIAHEEHRDEELLMVIHTHRVTRDATRRFYPVQRQVPRLAGQWRRGRSILDIAREWRFPPVLMGQMMLKELGIPRKKVWQVFLHPEAAPDARLRREVEDLLAADPIYSPQGMEVQRERGRRGEERLARWLERHGIGYRTEKDLRGKYAKTPDALLDDPIYFFGQKITWIESKANFGDEVELRKNLKRQLGPYTEIFGEGAVVYWYGHIEDAASPPGILLWDAETIEGLTPSVRPHPEGTPAVRPSRDPSPRSSPAPPP